MGDCHHVARLIMVWVAYFVGLVLGFWWGNSGTTIEDPFAWSVVKDEGESYD